MEGLCTASEAAVRGFPGAFLGKQKTEPSEARIFWRRRSLVGGRAAPMFRTWIAFLIYTVSVG